MSVKSGEYHQHRLEIDLPHAFQRPEGVLFADGGVLFADVESRKRREYLIALSQTGNKTQAARLVGVHPSTPYCPAWRADEAFQAGVKVARELAADLLEGEAFRRAAFGVRKPAGWYKGKPGGYVQEYSDILAIFLLKGCGRISTRSVWTSVAG